VASPEAVFVTGAARGIGLGIVRRFAAAGYTVGAVDVDDAQLAGL
jgi:NAD(P)-dependent dehydrogenase (short-subunit alcohol dehydrogenase family)